MPLSQYEEAHLCPVCAEPGKLVNKRKATSIAALPGTVVELLECSSDRCPDFMPPGVIGAATTVPGQRYRWSVQVNPDGTIPPKGSGGTGPKAFDMPGMHSGVAQAARDRLAYLAAADERGGDSQEAKEIGKDIGWA
jgi:hypothetical protein